MAQRTEKRSFIFAIHPTHGLLLLRAYKKKKGTHHQLPGGRVDAEELAFEDAHRRAAARELREETGYAATSLYPLGSFYTSPGMSDELMHAFVATGLSLDLDAQTAAFLRMCDCLDVVFLLDGSGSVSHDDFVAMTGFVQGAARVLTGTRGTGGGGGLGILP